MQKVIRISLFLVLGLVSFLGCSKKQTEKQQELILENETKPENSVFEKKKYPKKKINVFDKEINTVSFSENEFKISLDPERRLKINNLAPILVNDKPIEIELSFLCELVTVTEISKEEYWFNFESLDREDFRIINPKTLEVTEPFFDMKDSVNILKVDFENLVLFGTSWNSDKDFSDGQAIDYYLFSTKKKSRFKIETFIGEVPETDFVDFHTIQFKKKSGETITFDYGMWI
ncbi:MAG: hypothetical protein MJ181_04620 [Treponema sp.]|nr:hypothetical protein [Treponema sp.]